MNGLSLFWKVFCGTVAVILVTALGVYFAAIPSIDANLKREVERSVKIEARWAAQLCAKSWTAVDGASGGLSPDVVGALSEASTGSRLTLIRVDGVVLYDNASNAATMTLHSNRPEVLKPGTAVTRYSQTLGKDMTYFAEPILVAGQTVAFARVAVPVADREARLVDLGRAIRNGVLLAALVSLLLAGYFAKRMTHPLREIAALVREIGAGRTERRLPIAREDEVGSLVRSVNHMADALDRQIARIERDGAQREAIISALAGGLLAVDHEQRVLFINPQARQLLGRGEEELKGKHVFEFARNSALNDAIKACLKGHERVNGEARLMGNGNERIVEFTVVPLPGDEEAKHGCVLELRDVSDLRRLEAVRRDFVSNVSHELKTPLTAMRGYTEAMLGDEDMPLTMRRAFLEKAYRNTDRLAAIVVDLLSLSRLESSEHKLTFEELDAVELTRSVIDDLSDLAESRQTRVEVIADQPQLLARADPQALGMAISNLITNAIQYSPDRGEVRVTLTAEGDNVRIDVADRGPGIPSHEQERVFERFYRVDKARSRKLGGTGLGLSIVRHVMQAHGGKCKLESTPGRGSCFSLFIPKS